jgi:enoyl-CoA hydratase/carnithine racemase
VVSATLAVDWRADRVVATIDRPERRNALDRELIDDLHALLDRLEAEPRLLILTGGTGGTFASGADIGELLERDRSDALAAINLEAFERLRATPMPTIAAIDGHALGGGAELAYACDFRVASGRARFGQPEVQLGIMAAAGGCYRLPALVGEALAKEVLLAGRILDAREALACGLVSEVVEATALLDAAHALADRILKAAPLALRLTKQAVNAPAAAHPDLERAAQAILFESADKRERMRAFLDRRR